MLFKFLLLFTFLFSNAKASSDNEAKHLVEHIDSNENIFSSDVENIIEKVEENKVAAKKDFSKEVKEISAAVNQAQQSADYRNSQQWISENKKSLLEKQALALPKIDYDISQDERNKDAIAKLLHSYRLKPQNIEKNQVTHYPLMIFVSASIPEPSLKALMIQSKKVGGVLVLRGLIGNLKNTQEFFARVSKENASAIIDPRLFDLFQIKTVPTFVLLPEQIQNCELSSCQVTPKHDRIAGNITLSYALEQISNQGDAKKLAVSFLQKIEGGQK